MSTNIYDIPLKSWDGKTNMLEQYKGKVTLFINVTTDCGNAPEYGIIEHIYQKYKDRGFEVVAIPTNEYCGHRIVYDEFINGLNCAQDARDFATKNYNVSYNFSDLVYSSPGTKLDPENLEKLYPGRTDDFPRQLPDGCEPHPVFQGLIHQTEPGRGMFGNFEKYLVDKNGRARVKFDNGCLMPRFDEIEYGERFGISGTQLRQHNHIENIEDTDMYKAEPEYERICSWIEQLLNED